MANRQALTGIHQIAKKVAAKEASAAPRARDMVTTAIHISMANLSLLRRVAIAEADRQQRGTGRGGRPSVSGVLNALIDRHRAELEAMTAD